MLNATEALEKAKVFLSERSLGMTPHPVRVAEEASFIDGDRLIALWDTVEFLDGGNDMMRLGGNMPISVSLRTGECIFLTWEEAEDLMERGLF
ncbi:hypothetical protein [Streptomyces sp. MAI_2237]